MKSYEEIKEHVEMLRGPETKTRKPDYDNMSYRMESYIIFDNHFFSGFYPTLRDIVVKRMNEKLIRRRYFETNELIKAGNYEKRFTIQLKLIGERNAYAFALNWEVNPMMRG